MGPVLLGCVGLARHVQSVPVLGMCWRGHRAAGVWRGLGGAHTVLDLLEETIWPWQEAPWDFSIPQPVPKCRGVVFPCTRLLAGSGLGGCGLRSLLRSPAAQLRANPGLTPCLAPLATNSFSLPNPFSSAVRGCPAASRLLRRLQPPCPVLPCIALACFPHAGSEEPVGFFAGSPVKLASVPLPPPASCPLPAGEQRGAQPAPGGRRPTPEGPSWGGCYRWYRGKQSGKKQ